MKKLNIAMLSEQEPSSPEAVNLDDNFDDSTNTVLGGLNELDIAMQDLENIDEVITQAIDASLELKVEQEVVEQAQQQEPLSQTALEGIQRQVNRLVKRAGIKPNAGFALESYSNPHYNKPSMESAVQSIKDFLVKIWEAVKKAYAQVKDFIVSLLKKYFDESVKVKKSAQALAKKALSLQGKMAPASTKVGSFNLATYLRHDNKPIEPDDLVSNFDTWTKYTHDIFECISGKEAVIDYSDYVAQAVKVLEDAKKDKNPHKLEAEMDEVGNKMLQRVYSNLQNKKTIPNGALYQSNPLLGDIKYSFSTVDMEFSLDKIEDYKELPTDRTHNLLTVTQAHDLCVKIDKHMDSYAKIDAYIKDLEALDKNITKLAAAAISSNKTIDYVDNKIITRLASSTIKMFTKAIGKVGMGARRHDMNVDKAVLEWCSLSLRVL